VGIRVANGGTVNLDGGCEIKAVGPHAVGVVADEDSTIQLNGAQIRVTDTGVPSESSCVDDLLWWTLGIGIAAGLAVLIMSVE